MSPLGDLSTGGFAPLLTGGAGSNVERVVVCSGQLGAELERAIRKETLPIRLVRLEQLHPLPEDALPPSVSVCFAQEEPANMGAMGFVVPALERLTGRPVERVARPEAASPATGWRIVHEREQAAVIATALGS